MVKFGRIGRWLLLTFPRLFSLFMFSPSGPSETQMQAASIQHDFFGRGFSASAVKSGASRPDMEVHCRITGPDPFYISCAILVVQAAFVALEQRKKMPESGVFTPGAAFRDTALIQRLNDAGLAFQVISTRQLNK
jgi:short subunit dehydrogenase-like uncharacterized protein